MHSSNSRWATTGSSYSCLLNHNNKPQLILYKNELKYLPNLYPQSSETINGEKGSILINKKVKLSHFFLLLLPFPIIGYRHLKPERCSTLWNIQSGPQELPSSDGRVCTARLEAKVRWLGGSGWGSQCFLVVCHCCGSAP